jgi:RecA/RadA recombinase
LFYDCEWGTPPEYLKTYNIDTDRIIHIPVEHVEQLKFDIVKRLDEIKRGDHVFLFLDSLGSLPSKKEVEDANDEKSVADMTRAKSIRSLLRIVTPHLTTKDIPFIIVNHVYSTMELYSKVVIPGGSAVTYCANQVFVITKTQEKGNDGQISGYHFTINIEKSRYVKEKSRLSFYVDFKNGISKWSGLMDLALESGHVIKPSSGWYQRVDMETGEILEGKLRIADTNKKDFWEPILKDEKFDTFIKSKFSFGSHELTNDFSENELELE